VEATIEPGVAGIPFGPRLIFNAKGAQIGYIQTRPREFDLSFSQNATTAVVQAMMREVSKHGFAAGQTTIEIQGLSICVSCTNSVRAV
jgi:hypothetical protein